MDCFHHYVSMYPKAKLAVNLVVKNLNPLPSRPLKIIATTKRLTPIEKMSTRIGYMGAGFLVAAQWTIEPKLYIIGFICVIIQVSSRKQWNLVALNLNGLIAWTTHFLK